MSLTPGFILTDEYGDMIGLTLSEVGTVVDAYERGPAPDTTVKTAWPRLRFRWCEFDAGYYMLVQHVHERNGEGDTVIASAADIAEMRAILAGQEAPDTHPRAAAEERIVSTLAGLMRAKLAQRRHHGPWDTMAANTAMDALREEVDELRMAFFGCLAPKAIIGEAVDVAAYCAILIDVLSAEGER